MADTDVKFDRSISLLAWAYNEEQSVGEFLDRCVALLESTVADFEIILVNDGSTDSTREIAEQRAEIDKRIKVVNNEHNLNVGLSCRVAIATASKEYLFWQTVDWSYDMTELPKFLGLLKKYDVVQGVRVAGNGSVTHAITTLMSIKGRSDNWRAGVVSAVNYTLIRVLYGVPFSDYQNITFYPTQLVQNLILESKSSFLNPELLIKTYYLGNITFKEVPIRFIPRTKGQAKGRKLKTVVRSIWDICTSWLRWGLALRIKNFSSRLSNKSRIEH